MLSSLDGRFGHLEMAELLAIKGGVKAVILEFDM